MARVKRPETGVEARTVPCCKAVRGAVGRGEMPSERGDSWFSPKCIEVQRRANNLRRVERCWARGPTAYQTPAN